jgi:sortase (surface protein transpeptidase)
MGTCLELSRQVRSLIGVTPHERYQLRILAIRKGGKNRTLRDAAETYYGKADSPPGEFPADNFFLDGHRIVQQESFNKSLLKRVPSA